MLFTYLMLKNEYLALNRNPIGTMSQMIEEGKDKLEWYRQVDPTKLSTLKDLINAPNYKDNLGTLIKTIYEFAFLTYSGMPAHMGYEITVIT